MPENPQPLAMFQQWFELAQNENEFEPTAMTLATLDANGFPSARIVLLKKYDDLGFVFFTNYDSPKSVEINQHPKGALVLHWPKPFHRQIRIKGTIEKVSYEESNAYFQTRPRGSQVSAWASPQSQPIQSREELEKRVQEVEEKFKDQPIPCPENWGGFRLTPISLEFWQSEQYRLHNRLRFTRKAPGEPWQWARLAP